MNAKQELLEHIENREVKYVHVIIDNGFNHETIISGTLKDVLDKLDFDCDDGYGCQELVGNIWYTDGTWSERGEYDGAEWWEYKKCPEIPKTKETK